ncbi:S9 family peptidase [Steroidobacter sp.]|uniref:S9 family peptidase n=1 Tax=Steroidobacter sp. TaxID=1978227 RepID=UPI001A3BC0B4|nr:DPP IV N-terminal domain-containing protein [Steroidobacter sp.]MBL8268151.1 S9 family peptidase [Steroidobacter sp.]
MRQCLTLAALLCLLPQAGATDSNEIAAGYARAESLLSIGEQLHNVQIQANWIGTTDRFWYRRTSAQGSEFVLVDAARGSVQPAFDHRRLARSLSQLLGTNQQAEHLPFESFEFRAVQQRLRTVVAGDSVECELRSYVCSKLTSPARIRPGEVESPDGRWAASVRGYDLYIRSLQDDREIRLTDDGAESNGYGAWSDSHLLSVTAELSGTPRPARVLWSPDSKKLVSYRVDERAVPPMPFVQWVPPEGYGARPKVHWARVALPADEQIATARLVIFELLSGTSNDVRRIDVGGEPIPVFYDFIAWGYLWWDASSRSVYHFRDERGFRHEQLNVTDVSDGSTRLLVEEKSETYFLNYHRHMQAAMSATRLHRLSERDGWQHIYRHDALSGRLLAQLTSGAWRVDRVYHAEPGEGWVYFTAGGRESNLDPYYLQLYRVRSNGTRLERLTPEDQQHEINFSPSGRYFVDRYSRVDEPPTTVLRRADGKLVRVLERADISALLAQGWQKPERFKAKADDGVTDIYGTLYRPTNFDPAKKYAVLDDIYGGPQTVKAQRSFSAGSPQAELGFINVQIDGRGTPGRSRAFREASYGTGFADAGGLLDHIAVLEALADRYPYLDLQRVGIYGHSGGGYSSTRALLDYPDFYKVAVSSAGSHDQYLYQLEWGERFIGRPSWNPSAYARQANTGDVSRFKGRLLLAHGDLDDDVPIVNTMQVLDALIKANKNVELLIVPGTNHVTLGSHPYFIHRRWEYFVRHLL